ncbi:MAG TPA: glycosyltransferase [Thermoplasmata archaeon]|nr:glycosyltransferase [Thermoplasmata archaeon]
MRIFLLQSVWGVSASGVTGGGTYHFAELAKYWSEAGAQVWLLTNAYDHGGAIYKDIQHVEILPSAGLISQGDPIGTFREYFENFWIQRRLLLEFVRKNTPAEGPALVLPFSSFPADVLAGFYLHRKLGARIVVYLHVVPPPPWWCTFRRGPILRHLVNWGLTQFAFLLIKLGEMLPSVDQLELLNGSPWRFPQGVLEDWAFLPEVLVPPAENQVRDIDAAYVGALDQRKGIYDLVESWIQVVKEHPDACLVIGGHSYSRKVLRRIEKLIRDSGTERNFKMVGYLSESNKQKLLNRTRLFLYPSYEESWSRAVMEAAVHDCLPVTWNLPAYAYLGKEAARVPAGDVTQFARVSSHLLSSTEERDARLKSVRRMLERVDGAKISARQLRQLMFYQQYGKLPAQA